MRIQDMQFKKYSLIVLISSAVIAMGVGFVFTGGSSYGIGRAVGSGLGVILLSLIAGYIAYRVSRKNWEVASIVLTIAAVLVLVGNVVQNMNPPIPKGDADVNATFSKIVANEREKLPIQVDSNTKIVNVGYDGKSLIYTFEVAPNSGLGVAGVMAISEFDRERFLDSSESSGLRRLCDSSGRNIRNVYEKNGQVLHDFVLYPAP